MAEQKPYRRQMPDGFKGPGGPVRFMAAAEGYVMIRRPNCAPFIVQVADWNAWERLS